MALVRGPENKKNKGRQATSGRLSETLKLVCKGLCVSSPTTKTFFARFVCKITSHFLFICHFAVQMNQPIFRNNRSITHRNYLKKNMNCKVFLLIGISSMSIRLLIELKVLLIEI